MLIVLGWIWSLPLSVLGAVLMLFGGRFQFHYREGFFVFLMRGWLEAWFASFRMGGMTLGCVTFFTESLYKSNNTSLDHGNHIVVHEFEHFKQMRCWGFFYLVAYLVLWVVYSVKTSDGYWNNPFEVEARKASGEPIN